MVNLNRQIAVARARQGGFSAHVLPGAVGYQVADAPGYILYLDGTPAVQVANGAAVSATGSFAAGDVGPSGYAAIQSAIYVGGAFNNYTAESVLDESLFNSSAFTLEGTIKYSQQEATSTALARLTYISRTAADTPIGNSGVTLEPSAQASIGVFNSGATQKTAYAEYVHYLPFPASAVYYFYAEKVVSAMDFFHLSLTWDGTQFRAFAEGQAMTPAEWVTDPSSLPGDVIYQTDARLRVQIPVNVGNIVAQWDQSRMLLGDALYTGNYTPPTGPLKRF